MPIVARQLFIVHCSGAAAAESAAILQKAVRALRHDGDAPEAARFADEYLARFPDGDLVEEATAIAMQAHDRLRDAEARRLALRYLARFPQGRFRDEAHRVLAPE